ncbi:MAG: succinate dehydrogenase/fumarate reductase iron-sulfur subunit [Elusimicrobia bacterium]|nr:succinate dehydrogenase/fumarate reductase iron-sulfur subunit [Elusimicrobiota bacterium]
MNLTLKVWRQKDGASRGALETYAARDISPDASFLEMIDIVNEELIREGKDPIAFDNDCREGICGTCSLVVNGRAHGPQRNHTVCTLHMRHFKDGDVIVVEPWRSRAFPVIKDCVVDRAALDRLTAAGGYISVPTGSAVDANAILVPRDSAEKAMDAAACIGCGACVAACPNASVSLFLAAKISQLALLPQGQPERERRVKAMTALMKAEGFGNCSWERECEATCPKDIKIANISRMNREFLLAALSSAEH